VRISWDISFGQVVTMIVYLSGIAMLAWRVGQRFDRMERKTNLMFAWFLKQLKGTDLGGDEIGKFFGDKN
jgi:hypothetical protein